MTSKLKHMIGGTAGRRGAIGIITGTSLSQIIILGAIPLLTRLYSPSEFGVLAVITALAAILASVCSLRLDAAIPLPISDSMAWGLLRAGIASSSLICAGVIVGVWCVGDLSADLASGGAASWLWMFPVLALVSAIAQLYTQMAIRRRQYRTVAVQAAVRSLATVAPQVGLSSAWPVGGLLTGPVAGQIGSVVYLWWTTRARRASVGLRRILRGLQEFWRFPVLLTPAALLNVAGLQLPLLMIANSYGVDVAGYLSLSQRLLLLPMTVIGQAVAQVYVGELARMVRAGNGSLGGLFCRTSARLLIVAAVGLVAALGISFLVPTVLGPPWEPVVEFLRILSIAVAAQLVVSPVSQTLIVVQRPGLQFSWDLVRLIVVVAPVMLVIRAGLTAVSAVWAWSLAATLSYALLWIMTFSVVRRLGPVHVVDRAD